MHKFLLLFLLFAVQSQAMELIDPTKPTKPAFGFAINTTEKGLELNAILASKHNPVAIINGQVLHLNDSLPGYKVSIINDQSVTLTPTKSNGAPITLTLNTLDVKKPHVLNLEG